MAWITLCQPGQEKARDGVGFPSVRGVGQETGWLPPGKARSLAPWAPPRSAQSEDGRASPRPSARRPAAPGFLLLSLPLGLGKRCPALSGKRLFSHTDQMDISIAIESSGGVPRELRRGAEVCSPQCAGDPGCPCWWVGGRRGGGRRASSWLLIGGSGSPLHPALSLSQQLG